MGMKGLIMAIFRAVLPTIVTLNNDYDHYGNRNQLTLNDSVPQIHTYTHNKLNQLTNVIFPGAQSFDFDFYEDAG